MKESRYFVPIVCFALICWLGLIYYQPYAIFLPFLLGAIVELFRPFSKKSEDEPSNRE